jgi:hypothetical protein
MFTYKLKELGKQFVRIKVEHDAPSLFRASEIEANGREPCVLILILRKDKRECKFIFKMQVDCKDDEVTLLNMTIRKHGFSVDLDEQSKQRVEAELRSALAGSLLDPDVFLPFIR